ncbi:hypothetical protein CLOSTMETH_01069 [[Clostridium] methylpentosum DSM 5476]|uniref:Uncharacterized protein n=1 Tax=[Clostridium] methylpentosum DSM 5476 TaxID=537013 RepID=C0EB52_9FIRM|nr:hypothetical protein CLOSTMETH_01069 [[Clostridium] methylpentosum DSM 5476]
MRPETEIVQFGDSGLPPLFDWSVWDCLSRFPTVYVRYLKKRQIRSKPEAKRITSKTARSICWISPSCQGQADQLVRPSRSASCFAGQEQNSIDNSWSEACSLRFSHQLQIMLQCKRRLISRQPMGTFD